MSEFCYEAIALTPREVFYKTLWKTANKAVCLKIQISVTWPQPPSHVIGDTTSFADRKEKLLPTVVGVSPTAGIDHHGSASSVRNDETEGDVVDLTAVAAPLVHAA